MGAMAIQEGESLNNHSGFERGLWQRQSGWFGLVPQTSVFGTVATFSDFLETIVNETCQL
jgi:hypothetical protein